MSDQALDVGGASPRGMSRLLDLQELDLSIQRLERRLDELQAGGELAEARRGAMEVEGRLGGLRLSADQAASQQRKLEGDVDSMQRKIDGERRRLFDGSVANAKELQSIQAEVTNLESRRSRIEDQLLEVMEQREDLDGRLGPIEAELAE